MKLFKKKTVAQKINDSKATIAKLDKNQLNAIIGGTEGNPIGGIIVKGGCNCKTNATI